MQHFIYPENEYRRYNSMGSIMAEYDHEHEEFKLETVTDSRRVVKHISVESAAMLAGFILSKHPAIVKGDAMAFSLVTRACDAIHEPDFTVITPTNGLRATTKEPDTQDDEQDTGDLHPDQERRLTALREASKLLAGRLNHDRLTEWAEWILNGDTSTN